ncbi:MAG TPA: hypothetical protein DDY98_06065 [Ruminococcaceae bacterium]|nr:hypothetical protein [Oscillospiraceae bacterium]
MFELYTGLQGKLHIQGIAVDEKNQYIYCSFTTKLIKYDFDGNIVGSVGGLTGHMGCIGFCPEDGRVYGSLEYKNDNIGRGIHQALGVEKINEDAFYLVAFDTAKIVRADMDAYKDGIMTAVFLADPTRDYSEYGENGQKHRYGCSGIDGVGIAPLPGEKNSEKHLYVAYGIYNETNRTDNDHQVILCLPFSDFRRYEQPLTEKAMHRSGPSRALRKFFVFTGNTDWGVQNLEYDAYSDALFLAVYHGYKPQYRNYDMFCLDWTKKPERQALNGLHEDGEVLTLKNDGMFFSFGSTGMYSFGDGRFLFSEECVEDGEECSYLRMYHLTESGIFEREK